MKRLLKIPLTCLLLSIGSGTVLSPATAATRAAPAALSLKSFIEQATRNDLSFEVILINQLPLEYRRTLLLPDGDIMMDVKFQHNFYLDQDRSDPEAVISLSKLFPYNGTELSASYAKYSSSSDSTDESSLQFLISQPIARNAFGRGTRLLDKIIGFENEVSRYQIVEAYEDYLAGLTAIYYDWYSAHENLKVARSSYASNKKLLANILDRQRQNIALPIDVNKMELLLIGKKENVIVLQEVYDSYANLIFKAIRHQDATPYIPLKPERPATEVRFRQDYEDFTLNSRTYRTLRLLEQTGTLEVKKAADDLLPSTNLLIGYQVEGDDWTLRNNDNRIFAGISMNWPVGHSVDKARHRVAQIEHKKTVLSNENKYEELRTNLKNLYQQIQREQKLITTARKKITLAEAVLRDEAENYSFGKVTLNDYIDAVNIADETRFSYTAHTVQLNKLLVEWLRLTDRLVGEQVLDTGPRL